MPRRTPGAMSHNSLQEPAWRHGQAAAQEPVPVLGLSMADAVGGANSLLPPPAPQLRDHPWGQISLAQVIHPATFELQLLHPPGLSATSWGLVKDHFTLWCWELSNLSLGVSPTPP